MFKLSFLILALLVAHATAKFPTNCESGHNKVTWSTSTFNHDSEYFRINSGKQEVDGHNALNVI